MIFQYEKLVSLLCQWRHIYMWIRLAGIMNLTKFDTKVPPYSCAELWLHMGMLCTYAVRADPTSRSSACEAYQTNVRSKEHNITDSFKYFRHILCKHTLVWYICLLQLYIKNCNTYDICFSQVQPFFKLWVRMQSLRKPWRLCKRLWTFYRQGLPRSWGRRRTSSRGVRN